MVYVVLSFFVYYSDAGSHVVFQIQVVLTNHLLTRVVDVQGLVVENIRLGFVQGFLVVIRGQVVLFYNWGCSLGFGLYRLLRCDMLIGIFFDHRSCPHQFRQFFWFNFVYLQHLAFVVESNLVKCEMSALFVVTGQACPACHHLRIQIAVQCSWGLLWLGTLLLVHQQLFLLELVIPLVLFLPLYSSSQLVDVYLSQAIVYQRAERLLQSYVHFLEVILNSLAGRKLPLLSPASSGPRALFSSLAWCITSNVNFALRVIRLAS